MDVLDKLIRMDVVDKITPINDENNRKKSGYFISDNLSLFYYKYIFRNSSRMNIMDSDIFMTVILQKILKQNMSQKFLRMCAGSTSSEETVKGLMDEIFEKIGKYYYDDPVAKKNGEFDIVTQDDKGYIFL